MNNILFKIISHRKTTSDITVHPHKHQSVSSKLTHIKKTQHRRNQSRQLLTSKGTFEFKPSTSPHPRKDMVYNHNEQLKQAHTSANSRRNINKSIKKLRSKSFDDFLLFKPKEQICNLILKAFYNNDNGIKAKYLKKKSDNNDHLFTQQSLFQRGAPFSLIINPHLSGNSNSKKVYLIKSPLRKKNIEIKIEMPRKKQSNHKDNDSPNYSLKTETNKKTRVYYTKINDTFSFKNKINIPPSLLTQKSEFSSRINTENDDQTELSPTLSKRKTDQSISNKTKESKRVSIPLPLDNEIKSGIKNRIQIFGDSKIVSRKSDAKGKCEPQKISKQITALFRDIIKNNINYSQQQLQQQNNQSNIRSDIQSNKTQGATENKTPQINKYIQLYPQSFYKQKDNKQSMVNVKENNDTIVDKTCIIKPMLTDMNLAIKTHNCKANASASSSKVKAKILFENKSQEKDLRITTEGDIIPFSDDIETDCLFEEEESSDIKTKKGIPSFSPKHLSAYNCFTESGESELEILFKTKTIFPLILTFLDYESLAVLCMCNSSLRSKLKEVQYRWIAYLVFDPKQIEIKAKIRKSVWRCSKLFKERKAIQRIYCDNLYLASTYDAEIRKDLTRTFPEDNSFKYGTKNYMKLYHILSAYSNYNQIIGYAQGLNFLVANALFLFDKEYEVFIFVDGLISKFNLEQLLGVRNILKEKLEEVGSLLHKCVSKVMKYLNNIGLGHEFFTANWLLTLFSNSMRKKYLLYVWDFMIIYGKQFLYFFVVAIIIKYSNKIIEYDQSLLSQLMKSLLKSDCFEKDFKSIIGNAFELMRIYCL